MRRVIIATPSYDGKLCSEHVMSLIDTIILCRENNIQVEYLNLNYVSLTQLARNSLLSTVYKEKPESVVWIDSDISWNPNDFLYLVNSDKDVIGGTYPKKIQEEKFVVKCLDPIDKENDLIKVAALGFGFIKMSYRVVEDLWNSGKDYFDESVHYKNIFEVVVRDGQLWSEDVDACKKILDLGYDIYLDKRINCSHIGIKTYEGNAREWINNI